MAHYDNSTSRQRLVRVPTEVDEWLVDLSRKARIKNPDTRDGVATQINAILRNAYEKAAPRRKA